ncbi:MAG: hypothetical protein HZC42_12115 [Candidatus Eisenbacteria bacterium]|nr:hypothetical protein [Candidatus Eisenbacteria bacterium]
MVKRSSAVEGSGAKPFFVDHRDGNTLGREIGDVVGRLFRDARVSADRINARGDPCSIVDSALQEFISWENMPWE